jgi:hypothetical protein
MRRVKAAHLRSNQTQSDTLVSKLLNEYRKTPNKAKEDELLSPINKQALKAEKNNARVEKIRGELEVKTKDREKILRNVRALTGHVEPGNNTLNDHRYRLSLLKDERTLHKKPKHLTFKSTFLYIKTKLLSMFNIIDSEKTINDKINRLDTKILNQTSDIESMNEQIESWGTQAQSLEADIQKISTDLTQCEELLETNLSALRQILPIEQSKLTLSPEDTINIYKQVTKSATKGIKDINNNIRRKAEALQAYKASQIKKEQKQQQVRKELSHYVDSLPDAKDIEEYIYQKLENNKGNGPSKGR